MTDYIEKQIIRISDEEFQTFRNLVYVNFGINLTVQKKTLIESRFNKVLQTLKFSSFKEFCQEVEKDQTGQLLSLLINRISTNHTYFFRELEHFLFLKNNIIPQWERAGHLQSREGIRIWSAGCSSGEEPYSLAMEILEYFEQNKIKSELKILATDISLEALEKAAEGVYTVEKVKSVSPMLLQKYFHHTTDGRYKVKEIVRKMVVFKRLNLMRESFPFQKDFHLILCRNVMIYFDKETQQQLITKFFKHTEDNGYLFVGHSESLLNKNNGLFRYMCPAIYQKQG